MTTILPHHDWQGDGFEGEEESGGDVDEDPEQGGILGSIESVGGVFSSFLSRATGVASPSSPTGSDTGSAGASVGASLPTPPRARQTLEQLRADLASAQVESASLKEVCTAQAGC